MHRIHGDHASGHVSRVKGGEQVTHGRDLVALCVDCVLAEYDAAGMIECGNQMRRSSDRGPSAAHGLAVDRDHPLACDLTDPAPRERCQRGIQSSRVDAREQLAHSGLHRCFVQPEPVQMLGIHIEGPFSDRGERAGAGEYRADRDSEHPGERVTNPTWVAGIGNMGQSRHQVTGAFGRARAGVRGRWHRRVWSWFREGCVVTPIPDP